MPGIWDLLFPQAQAATPWQNPPLPGPAWVDPPPRGDLPIQALLQSLGGGAPTGAPTPAINPGIADFFRSMFSGNAEAVPGAVPSIVPPGQTPVGSGMFERPGPPIVPALANMLPPIPQAGGPSPAAGLRPDMPIPAAPQAPALPVPIPGAPTGPAPKITFGLPDASAATAARTITIGPNGITAGAPAAAPAADPTSAAMSLIRAREGFREGTYYDVNAHRLGYGSDTITGPDGTVRSVKEGDKVTREDAERDLARRTQESMGQIKSAVGDEAYSKLAPNQLAALASVTYNYGKVPDNVAKAVTAGNPEGIAKSIEELQGHNGGVNAERRLQEAAIARGAAVPSGMPGAPNISAPNLPIPSPTVPLQGLPANAFDKFNALAVTRPPPMGTSDRITNVLANMAAGAMGAKDVGSFLLGAGAGAGKGAFENIKSARGEDLHAADKQDVLNKLLAEVEVRKGEATQQGANYKIKAQNEDASLLNQVATEQAKLNTAAKNKVEELKNEIDWKKWQLFEPQVKADKDGVTIIKRNQDGTMQVTTQKTNEMDALADKMKDAATIYGKDSTTVNAMKYSALAKQGEPYVRREILRDMVEGNHARAVVGEENYKKLEKEAEKALDQTLRGKPELWDKEKKQKIMDLLWTQKLPDEAWLPYMLKQGNFGAGLLARPGV